MRRVALLVSVVALARPAVAAGQPGESDKAAAVALYDQAEKLMSEGRYPAACVKYSESNRLDPQLGALLHLADCYEKNGQLASAWARFRDALESAQKSGDPRERVARERANALEPRLSKLVIQVPPPSDLPGVEVRRNGTVVSRSLWGTAIPVDAGEHSIEVSAPRKRKTVAKLAVAGEGKVVTYEVAVLADAVATKAPPSSPNAGGEWGNSRPAPDLGGGSGTAQRTLGFIAVGLGLVGLGAGVGFELQRSSKDSDRADICPSGKNCTPDEKGRIDRLNEDVSSASTLRNVSLVGGGALLAGGAVLLLTAPSDSAKTPGRWAVAPTVAKGLLGVGAVGRW